MRTRPLVAVSVALVSAILLAGCSAAGPDTATTDPAATADPASVADLCSAAAPEGEAAQSVEVSGDLGEKPEASFSTPLEVSTQERAVLTAGDTELQPGDFIDFAYTIFSADSGEELGSVGYTPGEVGPIQVSTTANGEIFGCSGPGSRLVVTTPAQDATPALVYVLDVLDVMDLTATGEDQDPADGMPAVTLSEDGKPSITIPDADPPTETKVAVLKKGDGATVEAGNTVFVQYVGVKWSNGEEFDSTWSKGAVPAQFTTTGVVEGFKQALEGQTVGSQVEVVMPPKDGYGEGEINDTDLVGESLVFVVDILGTGPAGS